MSTSAGCLWRSLMAACSRLETTFGINCLGVWISRIELDRTLNFCLIAPCLVYQCRSWVNHVWWKQHHKEWLASLYLGFFGLTLWIGLARSFHLLVWLWLDLEYLSFEKAGKGSEPTQSLPPFAWALHLHGFLLFVREGATNFDGRLEVILHRCLGL